MRQLVGEEIRSAVVGALCAVAMVGAVATTHRAVADAGPESLAVVNGRVFDGTGAAPVADGVVLIRGDTIVAVGPAADIEISPGAVRIDARGGLVLPGVIDNHVHITSPTATGILAAWLQAGVTSLVDVGMLAGGSDFPPAGERVDAPRFPRLFFAGPIFTVPGGYPATRSDPGFELAIRAVGDVVDARAAVARVIEELGVDLIKVAVERGFASDYGDEGWPTLSAEQLGAIVAEARAGGLHVRAHVSQQEELRVAMRAGIGVAAHTPIEEVADEVLAEAVRRGVILVSTANIWRLQHKVAVLSNLGRYHRLGGRVALGTDYPFQEGGRMPLAEMQLLVQAGLEPVDVLVASTLNGALALGKEDVLGTLAAGKLADVIIVAGDPLADIADMAKVEVVILGGRVVRSAP